VDSCCIPGIHRFTFDSDWDSHLISALVWHCWLGDRKGIQAVKSRSSKVLCGETFGRPGLNWSKLRRVLVVVGGRMVVVVLVQGRSDGGYIGIYTPKSVYLKKLCGCSSPVTRGGSMVSGALGKISRLYPPE